MLAPDDMRGVPDLREEDFRLIAALVHREAGILIRDYKQAMVRGRLSRRVRELGLKSITDYCERLRGPDFEQEITGLLNVLTTNHTAFYREAHHFEHLELTALPELLSRGAAGARFRVWSAAASSGEEPYTIAATLNAFAGPAGFADLRVLATDIDTDMIARAQQGEYPVQALAALAAGQQVRLLPEHGEARDTWRVGAALRDMCAFRRLNIVEEWPFQGRFQIIFCRNMLIYFDGPTKSQVIGRLVERLEPGGFLYLGHSESLTQGFPGLKPRGRTIYQKA